MMKLFKTACLHYESSKVHYHTDFYERETLHKLQGRLYRDGMNALSGIFGKETVEDQLVQVQILLQESAESARNAKESFRPYDDQVILNKNRQLLAVIDPTNQYGLGANPDKFTTLARRSGSMFTDRGKDKELPELTSKMEKTKHQASADHTLQTEENLRDAGSS